MKKLILSVFIFLSLVTSQLVYAESSLVSGFIPGQIWYSKDDLTEGDTVYIHTAVWNGEDYTINVKVEFYDNDLVLGTRNVTLNSNELKDVYVSWKITAGDHSILAKITSSSRENGSSNNNSITLKRTTTSKSKEFVSSTIKNSDGESSSISNTLETQIKEVIPDKVINSASDKFISLEKVRTDTADKLTTAKEDAKEELVSLKNNTNESTKEDPIKKPFTYAKVFFLTVLSFILNNKIVFYVVIVLIILSIIRFIFRKVRNR